MPDFELNDPIVRLRNVSKKFGSTVAVDDLSLEIYPQDIFGFIGPNGAGKTTTLKLIATLLKSDSGSIDVGGYSAVSQGRAVRRVIGYMPDFLGVYQGLTVVEYLDFFGATYRIPPQKRERLIDDLLALTDLTSKADTLVTGLSRGMQQRLGLARALIHDPSVLLLDEPASGLDPRARVEIRELLKELSRMGKTIIISSHILADLEDLSNRIGIIEAGKFLYCGSLDDAMTKLQGNPVFDVALGGDHDRALTFLESLDEVKTVEVRDRLLRVTCAAECPDNGFLARRLVEEGFELLELTRGVGRLEDAFMSITQGQVQ